MKLVTYKILKSHLSSTSGSGMAQGGIARRSANGGQNMHVRSYAKWVSCNSPTLRKQALPAKSAYPFF